MNVPRLALAVALAFGGTLGLAGCGAPGASSVPASTPVATRVAAPATASASSAAPSDPVPPAELVFPEPGQLAAGSHAAAVEGFAFTFEAPTADWVVDHGETWAKLDLDRVAPLDGLPDGAAVLFWSPDGAYSDPCAQTRAAPVGPTASDLAVAISTAPGVLVVREPTDTTLGGLPAVLVELDVPAEAGCAPENLYLWYDTLEAWRWATALGDRISVWIVEVEGARLVVEAETRKAPGSGTATEVQALVGSIRFE